MKHIAHANLRGDDYFIIKVERLVPGVVIPSIGCEKGTPCYTTKQVCDWVAEIILKHHKLFWFGKTEDEGRLFLENMERK